jgi:hypothetical protein
MKYFFISLLITVFGHVIYGQALSFNGYSAGTVNTTYNTGTAPNNMRVVVTKNNTTQSDGSPKYVSADPGTPCYTAGSLALNGVFQGISSTDNANYTVTITFNPSGNGTCNYATFTIKDINSNESVGTFLDVIEISAKDGNNNAIAATTNNVGTTSNQITSTLASNVTRSVVSGTIKLVGHNNSSETYSSGSYFSSTCGTTTIRVVPPSGVPLKSITIKYRPAYGTSSNGYYNLSGPLRPDAQYISISNVNLTAVGGCTVLPIELISFDGKCNENDALLEWTTSSEINNDYFTIEQSLDGEEFFTLSNVDGAGNSTQPLRYTFPLSDRQEPSYFRLRQTDFDGHQEIFNTIYMNCLDPANEWTVYPNPTNDHIEIRKQLISGRERECIFYSIDGKVIYSFTLIDSNEKGVWEMSLDPLPSGIYQVVILDDEKRPVGACQKIVKL